MRRYYIYDLDFLKNIFTFCGKFTDSDEIYMFEISDRMNQRTELLTHLGYLRNLGIEQVGFNNIGYDYFLIHELMVNQFTFTYEKAYQISQTIVNSSFSNNLGFKRIAFHKRLIPQIDPYLFCHFDNANKRTGLKALQFAMRLNSIEEFEFTDQPLNDQEKDKLKTYNVYDVTSTEAFFLKNEHLLNMRREYLDNGILRGDVLNYNDVKIGMEYLLTRLGRTKCYNGSKPKQTFRESLDFNYIVLPKISFRTEMFQEVLTWFKEQTLYVSGGKRPKHKKHLVGLDFHFGVGGVHASAENKVFYSDEQYQIIDLDVSSMYPSVAIANRFAPEHLGQPFVEIYNQIRSDRKRHAKGTSQNAALKLALSGAYGNSNNPYSFVYDPKFTFSVTINGQLQLLQFAEMLDLIPDCEIIQANTDGVTVRINKKYIYLLNLWKTIWEQMTGLVLEEVLYKRMFINDVNNYISEKMNGELKRKGIYWHPLKPEDYTGWWNKDFSNLASKKAAEKVMTHSWPLEAAIKLCTDPFDFMLRYKATGASKLFIGDVKQLKTVRYYASLSGEQMVKFSPPTGEIGQYKRANKLEDKYFNDVMKEIGKDVWDARIHVGAKSGKHTKYEIRESKIEKGWKVKQCNVATDFDWNDVDWNYYIEESKKIIIGVSNV